MRIYKKDVNATNLIPLMAIHGGSWQYRGAGFVGMEAQISHYTDAGFVVFAPFYRLAGNADGNAECNGAAWTDITTDIEEALTWVQTHGATFGAKAGKISLMGQSAGAHLAGWLVTHRPNDVERALLLYPPADVGDFLAHARPGDSYEAFQPSLGLLATYFGKQSVSDLAYLTPYEVNSNSFPALISTSSTPMPPVFLIHGYSDTLVPSNQSVLMCNAYGGNAVNDGGGTALRATYTCGANGRLHLFQEAQHGLDACVTTRANGMCLAGSEASRSFVASSLRQARGWLGGDEFGWLVPIIDLILEN
jgi:acetyl esterase/lipase